MRLFHLSAQHLSRVPTPLALYFTPRPESDLAQIGASVLGYDCYTGAAVEQPPLPGIAPDELHSSTAEPRRYGFHSTLKAPFTLRAGCSLDELKQQAQRFAAEWPAFELGRSRHAGLAASSHSRQMRHPRTCRSSPQNP
ncbi:DUF1045 domain-containing protein [Microvirga sp. 3-52]|nr:DUF1045 domain-containing protein [Microvirga sp. 3-52]